MDERSKIILREGLAGVRPGLRGGRDVWEVVPVHRSFADVERTAELDQPACAVEIALGYYERHRDEIDGWILENEERQKQLGTLRDRRVDREPGTRRWRARNRDEPRLVPIRRLRRGDRALAEPGEFNVREIDAVGMTVRVFTCACLCLAGEDRSP